MTAGSRSEEADAWCIVIACRECIAAGQVILSILGTVYKQ